MKYIEKQDTFCGDKDWENISLNNEQLEKLLKLMNYSVTGGYVTQYGEKTYFVRGIKLFNINSDIKRAVTSCSYFGNEKIDLRNKLIYRGVDCALLELVSTLNNKDIIKAVVNNTNENETISLCSKYLAPNALRMVKNPLSITNLVNLLIYKGYNVEEKNRSGGRNDERLVRTIIGTKPDLQNEERFDSIFYAEYLLYDNGMLGTNLFYECSKAEEEFLKILNNEEFVKFVEEKGFGNMSQIKSFLK